MTGESKITEMIREIEQTFAERDSLYKQRDEAYSLQFRALKEKEALLDKSDSDCREKEEALHDLEETLKKKEEDLLAREKSFQEERESYEKEKQDTEEKLHGEKVRLNLLQAKLQNEKIRQHTEWLRHENQSGVVEAAMSDKPDGTVYVEKEPTMQEIHQLRAENGQLKRVLEVMKTARKEDGLLLEDLHREKEQLEKECSDLQKEKQELFKKLLAIDGTDSDPDIDDGEDMEYIDPAPEDDEDDPTRYEEFLRCFEKEFSHGKVEASQMEDGSRMIHIETDEYETDIFLKEKPRLEIGIPLEDNRKLRKAIQRINGEGAIGCRYERTRKEAVFTVPFQPEDEPEDVANLMRCILDYEVPVLKKEGGGSL